MILSVMAFYNFGSDYKLIGPVTLATGFSCMCCNSLVNSSSFEIYCFCISALSNVHIQYIKGLYT